MLFGGIPGVQKSLEGLISFSYKQVGKRPLEEHSSVNETRLHSVSNAVPDRLFNSPPNDVLDKNPNASVGPAPSRQHGFGITALGPIPPAKGAYICQRGTPSRNAGMSDFRDIHMQTRERDCSRCLKSEFQPIHKATKMHHPISYSTEESHSKINQYSTPPQHRPSTDHYLLCILRGYLFF